MRQQVNKKTIDLFLQSIATSTSQETSMYFTGGVTALLYGWRESTIDIDLIMIPENESLYQSFPKLKDSLNVNIEIASPAHFIPELPGWRDRSIFIDRIAKTSFYHYDLYSQAMAKIERGHSQDVEDVKNMFRAKLVEPKLLTDLFQQVLPKLYKYPAIDEEHFSKTFHAFMKTL